MYDARVFDVIRPPTPSRRGEALHLAGNLVVKTGANKIDAPRVKKTRKNAMIQADRRP
jgi:hypothetical protein